MNATLEPVTRPEPTLKPWAGLLVRFKCGLEFPDAKGKEVSSKSDPKPWDPITQTWDPMPGSINNDRRIRNYLKGGRKKLTQRQRRRIWKYTARSVHDPVYSCGHRMKKCDCPF